jgi:enterochelin esterase family protein
MNPSETRTRPRRLAINRLKERKQLDAAAVDRFLSRNEVPIVEGSRCTFLYRGEADEVLLAQRIVGLPELLPLRRLRGTDLWYLVLELPERSRVNYQLEVRRGDHVERINDPLNEKLSYSPVGTSSVCFGHGYASPEWTVPDPEARPGELVPLTVRSRALKRDCEVTMYLPARFRRTASYPLLVVHDGPDFLQYAAAKTALDNLIHRLDVAETVVAFLHPQDRLTEYADSIAHSRFLTGELLPRLETELPLAGKPSGRCLMGSSFGAVASLAAAVRSPETYGSLILMSGSFVFTDIGTDHGGGEVFDPVVKFVNKYRARPTRVAERLFMSCGVFEPLIVPNRSMVPTFESTGMTVRYVEARDGHNWENWRDLLRDAFSWVYPGPQKFYYE